MTTGHTDPSSLPEAKLVATSPSGNDECFITRTCHGMGCALKRHFKQFRVSANATNANDRKCPQCKTFEAALNKVLEIEEYL